LLRWDDTDAARASSENEHLLRAELADVAGITLHTNDNEPEDLHQSERRRPYREALDRLADLGLTRQQDGCAVLDLPAIDARLSATGVDPDVLGRERIVNSRSAPRPQHGTVRLTRSDGTALWHLATVVDDTEAGVNFVVRGIDKIDATSIQERLRAVLAPKRQVAYLFLPRLRPAPGAAKTRVADVQATGISAATLRWFLAQTYVIGEEPATTFDEIVERLRPVLPRSRDSQLDLQRLAAMERQLMAAHRRNQSS
jgi:glutamyl/glutaminyl-tRNA synthetase